jgi:hypothetical protein
MRKRCCQVPRPVQRAWNQDEYMNHFEEADALPPGGLRARASDAPMVSNETLHVRSQPKLLVLGIIASMARHV